jgi:endonuclease III
MQFSVPWYDLTPTTERVEAVQRVHDIIFSQVMAIAHSMIELGCSITSAREFVYRMCVIHQLSERQRQQLLSHLLRYASPPPLLAL